MFLENITAKLYLPTSAVLRCMWPFLLPPGDRVTQARMAGSVASVFVTTGLQALGPLLFAAAVDALTGVPGVVAAPLGLLLGYALVFTLARVATDGLWWLFSPLQWRLQRNVMAAAYRTGHRLGLRYHLTHKTGHITDIVSGRGGAGIGFLTNVLLGTVLPLLSQLAIVALLLTAALDARYVGVIVATVLVYGTVLIYGAEKQ